MRKESVEKIKILNCEGGSLRATLLIGSLCAKLILLIAIVILGGCNKPTDAKNNVANGPFSESAKIYPHSDSFKSKEHGAEYLRDKALCAKCHGADLTGGTSKVSCQTCHESFPHPKQWALQAQHGVVVSKGGDKTKASCITCHASEKQAAIISCQQCHANYPHTENWGSPENHGTKGYLAAEPTDQKACLTCHTGKETSNVISCQMCHEQFPHKSGWSSAKAHGETYGKLAQGDKETACLSCHTNTETSKKSVTCQQCHTSIFPHTPAFKTVYEDMENHMKSAAAPQTKCILCHQNYTKYMNVEKGGCMECHTGLNLVVKWVEASPAPIPPMKNK